MASFHQHSQSNLSHKKKSPSWPRPTNTQVMVELAAAFRKIPIARWAGWFVAIAAIIEIVTTIMIGTTIVTGRNYSHSHSNDAYGRMLRLVSNVHISSTWQLPEAATNGVTSSSLLPKPQSRPSSATAEGRSPDSGPLGSASVSSPLRRQLQQEDDSATAGMTADTLHAIQPTWRDEVHAVWINGPVHRAQLGLQGGVWPVFLGGNGNSNNSSSSGNTTTTTASTEGQCDPRSNPETYTGYTEDGSAYCQAGNSNFNDNPHLVLYSGHLAVVLDASYAARAGSLVAHLGSTERLRIDGTITEENIARPEPEPNNDTTTVDREESNPNDPPFLSARRVLDYLIPATESGSGGSSVRLNVDLICETHGFVELSAQPLVGEYAEFNLVRHGQTVIQMTVDNLQWTDATGQRAFVFDQNPSCQPLVGNNSVSLLGNRRFDNVTRNANATCNAANGNCCPDDYCFCNQNYISGNETDSCPTPEFPFCLFEDDDDSQQESTLLGRCYAALAPRDPSGAACVTHDDCTNPAYPLCDYDRCYADWERDCSLPSPWIDLTLWGDSLSIVAHWETAPGSTTATTDNCTGTVRLEAQIAGGMGNTTISTSTTSITKTVDYSVGSISLLLTTPSPSSVQPTTTNTTDTSQEAADGNSIPDDGLIDSTLTGAEIGDLVVTGSQGTNVLSRDVTGDIIVAVPEDLPKCSYNRYCGDQLSTVDVSATNQNSNTTRTLRFTLSRWFETGNPNFRPASEASRPGSEITGLNVMIWDPTTGTPLGIPVQISKNWHSGPSSNPVYKFQWWTANVLLRLPPSTKVDLTFAIVYEEYGGVPAFSHAQLSTIGLAPRWLLQSAALGTGGENFVVDPLGAFSRAMVTSIRPKLFDGAWKQDIGGADFLVYFDETGQYQYSKEVTSRLLATGPCLSNATYSLQSDNGAIRSEIQISGGRTDDIVRMFIHVRHVAEVATSFSRLAFFQFGAETYNSYPTFETFVLGSGESDADEVNRTCSGGFPMGTSRAADKMYQSDNGGYVRRNLAASGGPWWIAMGPNTDPTVYRANSFVVGDRGLVIRSFNAQYQGQASSRPSVSILCDKVELGPPEGLDSLLAGDFVDFQLEVLVLPRSQEFDVALQSRPDSSSLRDLAALNDTAQRVREHAVRLLEITSIGPGIARVESHYPIRICVTNEWNIETEPLRFTVVGGALGYVPLVLCNLATPLLPAGMRLWSRRGGEEFFTSMENETEARQVNYVDRANQKYEIVFNVEIRGGDNQNLGVATNDTNNNNNSTSEDGNTTATTNATTVNSVTTGTVMFFFGTEEAILEFEGRGSSISSSARPTQQQLFFSSSSSFSLGAFLLRLLLWAIPLGILWVPLEVLLL